VTSNAAAISHLATASPASASNITPGVLGFLVIAVMGVALFFLLRSMNTRLRRVRAVRDAGLPPGSQLDATANTGGGHGAATSPDSEDSAERNVAAGPADPAGGSPGG
jgi:hypothetical protein